MSPNDLSTTLLETWKQHLPAEVAWLPVATLGAAAAAGLVLMVAGARLARWLGGLVFATVGAYGGSLLSSLVGTPMWPSVGVAAAVAFLLGLALFRVWVGVLFASCVTAGALAVYGGQALSGPLKEYLSSGPNRQQQVVTLKEPGATPAGLGTLHSELAGLWSHLSGSVPRFQATVSTIAIATGLAGLIFGLMLPRVAAAVFATSLGTGLLVAGVHGISTGYLPAVQRALAPWAVVIIPALWGISLVCNLADTYRGRPRKPAAVQPGR